MVSSAFLLLLFGVEYPVLNKLTLQEPTDDQKQKVAVILDNYEVESLKFDRFMAKTTGSISGVDKRVGFVIKDFRSIFAEDFNVKRRRLMSGQDVVFRDAPADLDPRYVQFGTPNIDGLLQLGKDEKMWAEYGGMSIRGETPENDPNSPIAFTNFFKVRPVNNPFCSAISSVHVHIGCKCRQVFLPAFKLEKMTGYAETNGLVVTRWFHPVAGTKDPVIGQNEYLAFQNGLPVILEEVVSGRHPVAEDGSTGRHGYLQGRSVTQWGKESGFNVPIAIQSRDGAGKLEYKCQIEWAFNGDVPDMLFDEANVGKLWLSDLF